MNSAPTEEDAFVAVALSIEAQAAALVTQAEALRTQAAILRTMGCRTVPTATVEPIVDKREIARRLGVSVASVDRLDREGQPFVRVGDVKRYNMTEVLAWHRARTAGQPAKANAGVEPANDSGARRLTRTRKAS